MIEKTIDNDENDDYNKDDHSLKLIPFENSSSKSISEINKVIYYESLLLKNKN